MAHNLRTRVMLAAALCVGGAAMAQPTTPAARPAPSPVDVPLRSASAASSAHPGHETLTRMTTRRASITLESQRLQDVVAFLREQSGADLDPLWVDDQNAEGLDPDRTVTLEVVDKPLLTILERVLDRAAERPNQNTWQLTPAGALQFGPRERLNRQRRVQVYDVRDLLVEVPNFRQAPRIDLQQALQAAGGGGGGSQSPFQDSDQDEDDTEAREQRLRERADELQQIIRDSVEQEQWIDNGGEAASMRYTRGVLIVNAPDYIHRALGGYSFWPRGGVDRGAERAAEAR